MSHIQTVHQHTGCGTKTCTEIQTEQSGYSVQPPEEPGCDGAEKQTESTFADGVKDGIPTLLGYISIGLAAGIVGAASHLSVLEMGIMSLLVYAGAAQFIICGMLAVHAPVSAIILTTFIVNLRNFLLSATLAPHFTRYSLLRNIGIGLLVTDESFGVAAGRLAQGKPLNDRWMNGLNLIAYVSWVVSCVVGALFGSWIADPEQFGMDYALTAMFVALLVLQLGHLVPAKLKHYLQLMGYMVIAMLLLSLFVSSQLAVIIATVIVATIGVVTEK
ncbi:AzlC family ABC transporter permease [Paenibacillus bovis]|uniref:AzlC family ABC transporter permease n=1 Tax=Paenibacillus bovis TaxID=1616788 RepID=UPI0009E93E24|nr:AzlC family ABC transporter permease [Paenibacillus bovis]